jgi:hypothetical protein
VDEVRLACVQVSEGEHAGEPSSQEAGTGEGDVAVGDGSRWATADADRGGFCLGSQLNLHWWVPDEESLELMAALEAAEGDDE